MEVAFVHFVNAERLETFDRLPLLDVADEKQNDENINHPAHGRVTVPPKTDL